MRETLCRDMSWEILTYKYNNLLAVLLLTTYLPLIIKINNNKIGFHLKAMAREEHKML